MVNAAIAHVIVVHHIYNVHDGLRVVCGVAIHLYIEDVTSPCHLVIGSFHLGFVACAALIIHGYVVRIGVIVAVGNAFQHTEFLAVYLGELTRQAFGRCCQQAEVVVILLRKLVAATAHVVYDAQT